MKGHHQQFFTISLFVLIYLAFVVVKPLLGTIAIAGMIAVVLYPLYGWFLNKTKRPSLSSFIVCSIVLLLVILPLLFGFVLFVKESVTVYDSLSSKVSSGDPLCSEGIVCESFVYLHERFSNSVGVVLEKIATFVVSHGSEVVKSVSNITLMVFIFVLSLFYLLKDGKRFLDYLVSTLPLSQKYVLTVINDVNQMIHATVFGTFITAIAQGILGYLGLVIAQMFGADVSAPIFLGVLIAVFSPLPFVGPAIVWVPVVLSLVLHESFAPAIFLALYCICVVSTIDNYIKPRILSSYMHIHPLLVFLGVIGGLMSLGFVGVILGPLVIILLTLALKIYGGTNNGLS